MPEATILNNYGNARYRVAFDGKEIDTVDSWRRLDLLKGTRVQLACHANRGFDGDFIIYGNGFNVTETGSFAKAADINSNSWLSNTLLEPSVNIWRPKFWFCYIKSISADKKVAEVGIFHGSQDDILFGNLMVPMGQGVYSYFCTCNFNGVTDFTDFAVNDYVLVDFKFLKSAPHVVGWGKVPGDEYKEPSFDDLPYYDPFVDVSPVIFKIGIHSTIVTQDENEMITKPYFAYMTVDNYQQYSENGAYIMSTDLEPGDFIQRNNIIACKNDKTLEDEIFVLVDSLPEKHQFKKYLAHDFKGTLIVNNQDLDFEYQIGKAYEKSGNFYSNQLPGTHIIFDSIEDEVVQSGYSRYYDGTIAYYYSFYRRYVGRCVE